MNPPKPSDLCLFGTTRLSMDTVTKLELALGGDVETEQQILDFIEMKYGARNLIHLPARVAAKALLVPSRMVAAAKGYARQYVPF